MAWRGAAWGRGRRRGMALLPGVVALAACAATGRVLDEAPAGGDYALLRGVTLPRGSRPDSCGPEALAAVMNFWGDPVSVAQLEAATLRFDRTGMDTRDFLRVANRRGFVGRHERGSIGRIKEAVDRGGPSIVTLRRGSRGHALVAIGYSDRAREVLFAEPGGRYRALAYEDLRQAWEASGGFFLVVRPGTAEELCALGREARDRQAFRDAESFYELAFAREPACAEARTGLGDLRVHEGRLADAEARYREALALDPTSSHAANNIADLVLERGGDAAEAQRLAERALELTMAEWERLRRDREASTLAAVREELEERQRRVAAEHLLPALGTVGRARKASGDVPGALEVWRRGLALAPATHSEYRARRLYDIGTTLAPSARDEALAALREARELTKDAARNEQIEKAIAERERP